MRRATPKKRYKLEDLLKGMTPEAMRDAFDWGPDRGREVPETKKRLRFRKSKKPLTSVREP